MTILITGTTGTLGRAVVRSLATEAQHPPVRALVRDPARAAGLPGVEDFVRENLSGLRGQ